MPELLIIPNAALGQSQGEFGAPSLPPRKRGGTRLGSQFRPQPGRHRYTKRSFELAPLARDLDALRVAVQVGAAAGGVTGGVHGGGAVRPAHETDQRALAGLLPAGDAGADRLMPALRHPQAARRRWA